jgi:hypothetical protein
MVSAAIGQDDVLRMNHLEEALDPIQVIQYFRSDVIERLQKVYKGYGLPDEVIFQLDLQEAALADHRKIEILVLHKGRIAVYSRIYLGNKVMPYEQRHFGDRTPVVSLIRSAMYMGSVPNHLMPAERTMKPDGDGQTIFDRYRDDPEFSGCLFIEKGRTYTNPDLTSSELDEAKRLYFTILYSVYRKLAPNGDLSKIIQFANTGPAGRRHYRATYGFDDIPGGVLESGDFDPRFRFDIGVRVGDEIDKEKKEQENPRKIYLLVSTAEQFIDSPEVRKYLKRAVGKNTFLQIDPRFTYPGSFELGDGIVKTDLVNKVKRTKSF